MSRLKEQYIELKKKDSHKLYLFRCGNFYIFLQDDALKINDYVVLKITSFAKDFIKAGFPISSLDNYLRIFKNQNLDVEVIESNSLNSIEEKYQKIEKRLKAIDINKITPLNALLELNKLKEILGEYESC